METCNIETLTSEARERRITRTSLIGIGANLLLAGFKATVGLLSNSIAIVLDAVNNLTDALSSVITIAGIKLARRAPDETHPFGHGRIEYFSTISIAALVMAAGASSLVESIRKIVHPIAPEYDAASLVVVSMAVAVKLSLGRYFARQGRECKSDALVASGEDAKFDAFISLSTLAGAVVMLVAGVNIDGFVGAAISLFILRTGVVILSSAISEIMGSRPSPEISRQIREIVTSVPGVLGAHDLIIHNYGPDFAIGSIHVEIDGSLDAASIHRLTRTIQSAVIDRLRIFLTVGVYATDAAHEADRDKIESIVTRHPGVKAIHGLFFDEARREITFDILIDFSIKDRTALHDSIVEELAPLFPGYKISFAFDNDYAS